MQHQENLSVKRKNFGATNKVLKKNVLYGAQQLSGPRQCIKRENQQKPKNPGHGPNIEIFLMLGFQ